MASRLLAPSAISESLWDGHETLSLAELLAAEYREVLRGNGLLDEAGLSDDEATPIAEMEATDHHFAHRFSGSCARVELAFLDPKAELDDASDIFVRALAGGSIGILDVPCGSGAGSASLLTTLAELRRQAVLPREPLDVILVGADVSGNARERAREVHRRIAPGLEEQAIFVRFLALHWDVRDAESTTRLLDRWVRETHDLPNLLMLMTNFSLFLGNDRNFRVAEERLGEVLRWVRNRNSSIMWVEPQTKGALRHLWPNLLKRIVGKLVGLHHRGATLGKPLKSSARFTDPVRDGESHAVRLSLLRAERNQP